MGCLSFKDPEKCTTYAGDPIHQDLALEFGYPFTFLCASYYVLVYVQSAASIIAVSRRPHATTEEAAIVEVAEAEANSADDGEMTWHKALWHLPSATGERDEKEPERPVKEEVAGRTFAKFAPWLFPWIVKASAGLDQAALPEPEETEPPERTAASKEVVRQGTAGDIARQELDRVLGARKDSAPQKDWKGALFALAPGGQARDKRGMGSSARLSQSLSALADDVLYSSEGEAVALQPGSAKVPRRMLFGDWVGKTAGQKLVDKVKADAAADGISFETEADDSALKPNPEIPGVPNWEIEDLKSITDGHIILQEPEDPDTWEWRVDGYRSLPRLGTDALHAALISADSPKLRLKMMQGRDRANLLHDSPLASQAHNPESP
eukprot:s1060_g2.t1